MACFKSATLWNTPLRRRSTVMLRKKRSTLFSQAAKVGVKWMWKRGCLSSHALTFGCLWVASWSQIRCNDLLFRCASVDQAQEFQPLTVTMLQLALCDHLPLQGVERRKQGGDPMTLVVVCHGRITALLHRQTRLTAIQRLDLTLLVAAQHQRMVRGCHIQANNGFQLLRKLRIVGSLERLHPMRLQAVRLPHPPYCGVADPHAFRHAACTPLRRLRRLGLRRQPYDLFDLGRSDARGPPATRQVFL